MLETPHQALLYCGYFISAAVLIQTLEMFFIRHAFSESGVWAWSVLKKDFTDSSFPLLRVFAIFLSYPIFQLLLVLRLFSALLFFAMPNSVFVAIMLFTTFCIALRWRGTFNGGSDYMTVVVLLSLTVGLSVDANSLLELTCLAYIAIQSCLSYFISGIVKLRQASWRSGRALWAFLHSTIYEPSALLQIFPTNLHESQYISFVMILFECTFPLAFLNSTLCLAYLCLGFCFHLSAAHVFGLNRFVLAWASTYPAIYFSCKFFNLP